MGNPQLTGSAIPVKLSRNRETDLLRIERGWEIKGAGMMTREQVAKQCWQAPGTLDGVFAGDVAFIPRPSEVYPNAYLVDQSVTPAEQGAGWILVKVYEELPETGFVQAGGDRIDYDLNGLRRTTRTLVGRQSTEVPLVVGESVLGIGVPGPGGWLLENGVWNDSGHWDDEAEWEDGGGAGVGDTLGNYTVERPDRVIQRVTAVYLEAGVLSVSVTRSNQGKLERVTVGAWNMDETAVRAALSEVTASHILVETGRENVEGFPVRQFTFVEGDGRVSRRESSRARDKVKLVTVRYLNTDDGPEISGVLIDQDFEERDGHRLYSDTYVQIVGDGMVSDTREVRNGGKLVIYRRVRVGTAPTAPSATIGGTVVLTDDRERQEDGYTSYDYSWAEGQGEISRQTESRNGGNLTLLTIRFLTAPEASQPTPSGVGAYLLVSAEKREESGHALWVFQYAQGSGLIQASEQIRNQGALVLITHVAMGTKSTPTGTVIEDSYRVENGYTLYTVQAAQGSGEISREERDDLDGAITYTTVRSMGTKVAAPGEFENSAEDRDGHTLFTSVGITVNKADLASSVDERNQGALTITTTRRINSKPSAVGVEFSYRVSERRGYTLHEVQAAQGSGEISREERDREDGAVRITRTTWLSSDGSPGTPPAGKILDTRTEQREGHTLTSYQTVQVLGTGVIYEETRQGPASSKLRLRARFALDAEEGLGNYSNTVSPRDGYWLIQEVDVDDEPETLEYQTVEYVSMPSKVRAITIPVPNGTEAHALVFGGVRELREVNVRVEYVYAVNVSGAIAQFNKAGVTIIKTRVSRVPIIGLTVNNLWTRIDDQVNVDSSAQFVPNAYIEGATSAQGARTGIPHTNRSPDYNTVFNRAEETSITLEQEGNQLEEPVAGLIGVTASPVFLNLQTGMTLFAVTTKTLA